MPARRVSRASGFLLVLTTAGSTQEGRRLARAILGAKKAACINLIPKIESWYWWKGRVEHGDEVLLLIKTRRAQLAGLTRLLKQHHSYDLPELIALPIQWGDLSYLEWLRRSLLGAPRKKD